MSISRVFDRLRDEREREASKPTGSARPIRENRRLRMPNFILLLHTSPSKFKDLSPQDMQAIIARYAAWRDELVRQNRICGGEKLTNDGGRRLRMQGDKVSVTDGPYSEAAEVLGGYFMIEAKDYDDAVAVARTCPHLTGTQWIEVRQIDVVR